MIFDLTSEIETFLIAHNKVHDSRSVLDLINQPRVSFYEQMMKSKQVKQQAAASDIVPSEVTALEEREMEERRQELVWIYSFPLLLNFVDLAETCRDPDK